ncbi:Cof-type HAD-IIB family hydrolase [Peribacillus sp. SCS-155]|uniref:Cof-type HAD-IIB family hydrolase n=1 Tax=Peribacillus sedimenti TaxID=3115297 RepID=UPI003906B52C
MVYRLLAVNIDGTLLQSNGRINKLTKESLEYVYQKGVRIALVTSRHYHSARKIAKAIKADTMLVANQGAFIGSTHKNPIYIKRISEDLTLEIAQLLEKTHCQIQLFHEKFMLGNRVNLPDNLLGRAVMYMSEQSIYSQQYVDVLSDELAAQPVSPQKIDVLFDNREEKEEIVHLVQSIYPEVNVWDLSGSKLSIVAKGVSKWNGLLRLAEYLDITRNEIVAIGDGIDDLEMVQEAGLGVAMGNAPDSVKKAAKWVTRTNDDQGVPYMLKEFFRKQHQIGFLEKMNILKQ